MIWVVDLVGLEPTTFPLFVAPVGLQGDALSG